MFEDYPYGGLGEYMTAPQYSLVTLPDNVSFETAARWGYLGTAYSTLKRSGASMGTSVLVNGISGDYLVAVVQHRDDLLLVLDLEAVLTSDEQRALQSSELSPPSEATSDR